MNESLPEAFGPFVLLHRIAIGATAEIYAAQPAEGGDRRVAVKRYPPLDPQAQLPRHIAHEVRFGSRMHHPNLVRLLSSGRAGVHPYVAMEWVEGKSLRQLMRKLERLGLKLTTELAVYIACEACKALDHLHRQQGADGRNLDLVHRDTSPGNILLGYDGTVKLGDYGDVRPAGANGDPEPQRLPGQLRYLSPEQAQNEPLTQASDQFSLAAILHELLTGQPLFTAERESILLSRVQEAQVDPPSLINPEIPPLLDRAVMQALAPFPADRHPSIRAFWLAIDEYGWEEAEVERDNLARIMERLFDRERVIEQQRVDQALAVLVGEVNKAAPRAKPEPSASPLTPIVQPLPERDPSEWTVPPPDDLPAFPPIKPVEVAPKPAPPVEAPITPVEAPKPAPPVEATPELAKVAPKPAPPAEAPPKLAEVAPKPAPRVEAPSKLAEVAPKPAPRVEAPSKSAEVAPKPPAKPAVAPPKPPDAPAKPPAVKDPPIAPRAAASKPAPPPAKPAVPKPAPERPAAIKPAVPSSPPPEPIEEDPGDLPPGPETGTLLIVDSDAEMRSMLVNRFGRHGYRAIGLPTGAEALERLRDGGVDIVLLAMAMPRPSGPEVLRAIRQNWTPPELPVLMLSSQERARDLLYSLRLGANDYLPKGADFNVLHARVRTQLMLKLTYEALRLSEERYEALADQSEAMVFQLSPTGEIVYASRSSRDVVGYSAQALVGRPLSSLLSPADAEALAGRAMHGESFPEVESELIHVQGRDRQPIALLLRMKVLRDPHGSGVVEIHGALSRPKARDGASVQLDDPAEHRQVTAALARAGYALMPDPAGGLRIVRAQDGATVRR